MIQVDSLCKVFDTGKGPVLKDMTFSVDSGRSLAVIGPSGCGKTTLLYLLSGLVRPSSGSIRIHGRMVSTHSDKDRGSGIVAGKNSRADTSVDNTAFILQDFGLLPWKTVWQNVCLGMKIKNVSADEQENRARTLLEELGLSSHCDSFPARLSGGEKQRVAIARALATRPGILLMDEPFSALDTLTRERLQELLIKLWHKNELTMVIVTHSIEEAVFLGSTIMVMDAMPGRIRKLIDNPGAGDAGLRGREEYFHLCREVRCQVEMAS